MRKYFRNLLAKTESPFYPPKSERDDSADKLFRRGTTSDFPTDVLARYEYDRATSSEADLPGYIGDADNVDDEEDAVERYGTSRDNNNALPRPSQPSTASPRYHVLLNEQPTGAVHVPSPSRSSPRSFRTTGDAESKKEEDYENDYTYSDANEHFGDQPELHVDSRTPASLGTQHMSAIAQEMTSEEEELPLKLQSSENHDDARPTKQSSRLARTPTAATGSILSPSPFAAQGMDASYPPSRARNTLEDALSRAKIRHGTDSEHDALEQRSIHSPGNSGKRKRGDKDVGDSLEDEVPMRPTERKKSKPTIRLARNFVHP